jgi:WD40-like Beta Propeller Repeat
MRSRITVVAACTAVAGLFTASAAAKPLGSVWSSPVKVDEVAGNSTEINTISLDGCPILSPDGRSLFMASNRPGGHGGLDIWVARRESVDAPFGAPENLPAPINSAADDFCPTPLRGGRLLFVSRRTTAESCGMGDIYTTRLNPVHGWREPSHLTCAPAGPNSTLDEQGPSYVEIDGGAQLYFSRSSPVVPGDIYVSPSADGEGFGPAAPVSELNSAGNDIQPNVRKDGREIVFASARKAGAGQDIWSSTRRRVHDPWSEPVNLGEAVNTPDNETRPSLSRDGTRLYFGRGPAPVGPADIHVSTRDRLHGR